MSESESYCRECGRGSSAGHVLGCSADREAQARRERIATAVLGHIVGAAMQAAAFSGPLGDEAFARADKTVRERAPVAAVFWADALIAELSK